MERKNELGKPREQSTSIDLETATLDNLIEQLYITKYKLGYSKLKKEEENRELTKERRNIIPDQERII